MTTPRTGRALIVVDVQNDFCEGGALAVNGGADVAAAITEHLRAQRDRYDIVIGSLDDHLANSTNSGHIALPPAQPDYVNTWPVHCVQGTWGAQPHPNLDTSLIDLWVKKGQGVPAYSAFEARDAGDHSLHRILIESYIDEIVVVGLTTDYCVQATCHDARNNTIPTLLDLDRCAAVHPENLQDCVDQLTRHGVVVTGWPTEDEMTGPAEMAAARAQKGNR